MFPSPDILNEFPDGKFVLSNLAAKRAKQLREGAPPLVQVDSQHPLTIALAEIAAGKIKPVVPTVQEIEQAEAHQLTLLTDEPLPAELGMLLPALDETEAEMVAKVGHDEQDHEEHEEHEEHEDEIGLPSAKGKEVAPMSLADLVHDEEEETPPAETEGDTLSLTDIAEQETSSADDDEGEHEE